MGHNGLFQYDVSVHIPARAAASVFLQQGSALAQRDPAGLLPALLRVGRAGLDLRNDRDHADQLSSRAAHFAAEKKSAPKAPSGAFRDRFAFAALLVQILFVSVQFGRCAVRFGVPRAIRKLNR